MPAPPSSFFEIQPGLGVYLYRWFPPDDRPLRGIVQVVHGLAEHAARYERFALALNQAGFAVVAHDQRGHGKSIQKPEDQGFFAPTDGWNHIISDVFLINKHLSETYPGLPRFLFGHSMGSFIGQGYLSFHSETLHGALLSATFESAGMLRRIGVGAARLERWRLGPRGKSKLLHSMSFGDYNRAFQPSRTDFDWLSRDPAEVDAYTSDPLCGFVASTQLWLDFLLGLGLIAEPSTRAKIRKDLPVYLLTGGSDPVTRFAEGTKALAKEYRELGLRDVTLQVYPEARHEILNETNREQVLADILAWLERTLSSLPKPPVAPQPLP